MALLGGRSNGKSGGEKKDEVVFVDSLLVKQCPECFINLPLDATECFACHTRVGKSDRYGKAKKSVDWVSYIICIVAWAVFFIYIKWAFNL